MKFLIPAAAVCALLFCALFAGCTSPTEAGIQPVGTTVVTPEETTQAAVPPTPTFESVVPLPPSQTIYFSVTKDRPTGKITLQCSGGPGMSSAQVIDLTVTHADGTVVDQQLTNNNDLGQIKSDASITVPGTLDGTDHARVHITMGGNTFLVYDQDVGSVNPYSSTYSSLNSNS
ncbi:hypothetical protein [Methanoregula sp.]|uniref:hypothetical protein n=1 Tax=Methanoregula sp. TaxID=2052170 RepID=UPI002CF25E39|nr:hypothetical protein [Methanoregula sp.]HVP96304.1 hypothetical protein [Methanoregula sp.]